VQHIPEESQRFEPRSVAFALEQANDDGLYVQILHCESDRVPGEAFQQALCKVRFPAGARTFAAMLLFDWR
jgi:hypothetical protein